MKADTTRSTFNASKHYNGVRMQQGRVQIDADWNEQIDITGHRIETETLDVIGYCGAPMHDSGFHIVASANDLTAEEQKLSENQNPPAAAAGDLLISGGRYYVDGTMCENEHIVAYTKQPDLPNLQVVTQAGTWLAYVDVWSRNITALEDASIREVALGGPDTATRSKSVWQVKLFRVGDVNLAANCSSDFKDWTAEIAAGTGKLAARAAVGAASNDPCIVAPGAGYRRLENQHYRVEVHDAGTLNGDATFKWSRENGSVVTAWESQDVDKLTVKSIGRDKVLSFASGQWVELIDDTLELLGKPGTLVQLTKAEGNILTINPATATGPVNLASFPRNPKVRRWEMAALLKPTNSSWIDLEDGGQVQFAAGTYKTGDYWLIPARTATGDVEWPLDPATNKPAVLSPFGILHRYCRLSVLKFDGAKWTSASDCRDLFPPLTELTSFFYVGGDGQEAMPDLTKLNQLTQLAQPLEAGVANGQWPVVAANVRFKVIKGNGRLQGNQTQVIVATGANGIASCTWSLDATTQSQQAEAVLLDASSNPIDIPIHYTANLSVASQVAYDPGNACASLQNQKTVQDAIDKLASLASLYQVSGDDQSVLPTETLDPLIVIAASKCGPVAGMKVVFTIITAGGKVNESGGAQQNAVTITTDANGEATCDWTLGAAPGAQVVEAVLLPGPNAIVPPSSVRFTAQVRGAGADPGFHVNNMQVLATGVPLRNNMDLGFPDLAKGLRIDCDKKVDAAALASKHPSSNPVCFVTVEIPFPFSPMDRDFYNSKAPAGFQPVILGARAQVKDNQIGWIPTNDAMTWISVLFQKLKQGHMIERVLTRVTLKGNFVWSRQEPIVFLDGEVFAKQTLDALQFPSGDQIKGGNLEMWFWLVA